MQVSMPIARSNMVAGMMAEGGQSTISPRLEEVYEANKDLVFRAAYRITGNAGDAEDVLQTVFLRLLRQEPGLEMKSPRAYLHRAAVNAALDLLRARKDHLHVSLDGETGSLLMPATPGGQEAGELRQWLRLALARLNPRWAEMFVLRFVEDLSNREIAALMNTSSAVVAVVLHRTRTQLKKDYLAVTRGRP